MTYLSDARSSVFGSEDEAFFVHADTATGVLRLRGELDYSVCPLLSDAAAMMAAADTAGSGLTFQLAGLTFIDAAGIGVLIALADAHHRARRSLTLVGTPPRLVRVFELAGAGWLLTTLPDGEAGP